MTQCIALVGKRWAPDGPRRCKHKTIRSKLCWAHLKEKEGLRVTKVPHAKLGLVTTKPIPKDEIVTSFDTSGAAEFAQPSIRPNAKIVKKDIKSIKDIDKNSEVTIPASTKVKLPKAIIEEPKRKKMKLIKPDHGPDLPDWPAVAEEPERKPRKPRVRKPKVPKLHKPKGPKLLPISTKVLPKTADERSIDSLLIRLDVLERLYNSERMAKELKIPVAKHDIKLPPTGPKRLGQLMKLYRTERQSWVDRVNKGPYQMTDEQAMEIIDKMANKEK